MLNSCCDGFYCFVSSNIKKCWVISAPSGHVVKLTIKKFHLEKSGRGGTCFDYLAIRDGKGGKNAC